MLLLMLYEIHHAPDAYVQETSLQSYQLQDVEQLFSLVAKLQHLKRDKGHYLLKHLILHVPGGDALKVNDRVEVLASRVGIAQEKL